MNNDYLIEILIDISYFDLISLHTVSERSYIYGNHSFLI